MGSYGGLKIVYEESDGRTVVKYVDDSLFSQSQCLKNLSAEQLQPQSGHINTFLSQSCNSNQQAENNNFQQKMQCFTICSPQCYSPQNFRRANIDEISSLNTYKEYLNYYEQGCTSVSSSVHKTGPIYENTKEIARWRPQSNFPSRPKHQSIYENVEIEQFGNGQDKIYDNFSSKRTPLYPSTAFETTHHENTEHLKSRVCKINTVDEKERKTAQGSQERFQLDGHRSQDIPTSISNTETSADQQKIEPYYIPTNIYENFYGNSSTNHYPPTPYPRTSSLTSSIGNPGGPKLEEFHNATSNLNVEPNIWHVTPGKDKNRIDRYQSELDSSKQQSTPTATIAVNIRRNSEQSQVENHSGHFQNEDYGFSLVSEPRYDTLKPFEVNDFLQGSSLESIGCLTDTRHSTNDDMVDTLKPFEWNNTLREGSEEIDIFDVHVREIQPIPSKSSMLGDLWSDLDKPEPSTKPVLRSNVSVDRGLEYWKRYAEDVKQQITNAVIGTEPFEPKISEKEYSEDEEENTTINRDFHRKFQEQTKRNQEELRRKREERAARRREHEEELSKMRQESKQKYLMFFNCLGLKLRFEEQEHNWREWIQGCKQCISKLIELFSQFVSEIRRNYRGLKHLNREDEADLQTEISFLLSDIMNTYNSLEDSFEQLTNLESRFEDVMFNKVLKKCIAESATRLLKAYNTAGELSEHASQDNFQNLQNTFKGFTPSLIYSTTDLRRICKENSYSDNYENVQFPQIRNQKSYNVVSSDV
ncbi:Protein containing ALS2cr12 (ALS2CR12) signature [Caenorhabditis elegans]|nr:Protein containing ALS2cr12 (ALS2CR12) signature [Caenorhabditis elegans]CTQ86816.1 Protein containing ALS2cr12 (ALS2CR12) signature [Caenorhabditis elegans]|eukprot:NP_001300117.1 Uncharacterized protein CELE_F53H2.1 [Caenorhabditis elegans]